MRTFIGVCFVLLVISSGYEIRASAEEAVSEWGKFDGLIQAQFNADGHTVTLTQELIYTDPDKVVWGAPKGTKSDGASIPRPFWTVVGGPFDGKYVRAAVIHDYYCDHRTRPWQAVAYAFYRAMRCAGVSQLSAKTMYYAVYHFGPHWGADQKLSFAEPEPKPDDVKAVTHWVEENNPDIETLRQTSPSKIAPRG